MKKVLVTAGPTIEPIDPVRYISNHSSGKMGYAIAESLAEHGAEVVLVSGPVNITLSHHNISIVPVNTAEEMYRASVKHFPACHAAVMCAAVADYSPVHSSASKIKRTDSRLSIAMKPNKDIAAELGRMKKKNQVLAGFALETENGIKNAQGKIKKKNLDFIVLNSLNDKDSGFRYDTNKITIIGKDNKIEHFPLKTKKEAAGDIVKKLFSKMS